MALFDHFAPDAGPIEDAGNGFVRYSANQFATKLSVLLNEGDKAAGRAELIAEFDIQPEGLPQLDELLDEAFAGSPISAAKQKYFRDVRDAFVGYESGSVDKLRAETNAQVTPSAAIPQPLQAESGEDLLLEDGTELLVESN